MGLHLSVQFPELFRRENYAVNLALVEERQLDNPLDTVLASRPIEGVWDKEYSVVPFGELEGRKEGEPIPQKSMTTGFTTEGAIAIEASGKVGLSKLLQQRSKDFKAAGGGVDEPKFAGHLADTVTRSFLVNRATKWRKLSANIFNYGGIAAGHEFFNHRTRTQLPDLTDRNTIYDARALFALPSAPHYSYAASATKGLGSSPVGNYIDYAMTIVDTGGYFNAFVLPPSYWALKRVVSHWINNMQFNENDEAEDDTPDTLVVSSYNLMKWMEILGSKFVEPTKDGNTTNIENVFQVENFKMRLVPCRDLIKNTWYVGKSKSQGILLLNPKKVDDPWATWRDETNRSYWTSYEDEWGFMVRNWRRWCGGAVSTDGSTAPTFSDSDESTWETKPDGI